MCLRIFAAEAVLNILQQESLKALSTAHTLRQSAGLSILPTRSDKTGNLYIGIPTRFPMSGMSLRLIFTLSQRKSTIAPPAC